jgi:hypothetical protein
MPHSPIFQLEGIILSFVPRENHQPAASHWQIISHSIHNVTNGHQTCNFGGDRHPLYIGRWKSNHHMIVAFLYTTSLTQGPL